MQKRTFDLEERLVDFASSIIGLTEYIVTTKAGNHLVGQITRSGTSPALNYGEAQAAESKNDFEHKMKICLKELRETQICLKIIQKSKIHNDENSLMSVLKECSELVAIFQTSVKTSELNRNK